MAREFFRAEHGREPVNARELTAQIAKDSRPRTQPVAGYDLTFSPVKSVSTLWAVADPAVAAVIEQAHQAAIKDTLTFIEKHALFTRTGPQGIRQVNVRGLVATAFTHRDSRAGDPDLHTHVAVANKVQTLDGRWLSIDGRVLFKANVAVSETYNTALEHHLRDSLGVRFAERPGTDPTKRPIREIVGVDPRLNQRWSTRRARINIRRDELAIQFQHDHGRPPTPVEALHLAQQATLETRDAKHEPRSLTEQRTTWMNEASVVLGGSDAVASMVRTALAPPVETARIADSYTPSDYPPTTSASRPVSATPPPSIRPKASPPTPCTDSSPGRSPGSSCTPCSPVAGSATASTCRSSGTATRTRSFGPKPSHPAPRPRPCSRSSLVTTPPPQPPPCCESSATRQPGCSTPFSATPTGSMSRPSSWLAPRPFRCSIAKPTR